MQGAALGGLAVTRRCPEGRFGELAVRMGYLSGERLEGALEEWRRKTESGERIQIGRFLLKRGLLTSEQLLSVLRRQRRVIMKCPRCGRRFTVPMQKRAPTCPNCRIPLSMLLEVSDPTAELRESRQDDTAGLRRLGKYEILATLGQGAKGVVYKARDPELDRIVAVKVLKFLEGALPDQVRRFVREARLAGKLRHPNLVRIHDIGSEGSLHFFSMDLIPGDPLDAFMRRKPLGVRRAAELVGKIARAVHYAHTQGVIHRDLKPGNIMIDERGEPVVMDFGLAKLLTGSDALTKTGTVMGTPNYMSPEQVRGRTRAIDARSDVFSLGIILFECVTRRLPFTGTGVADVMTRIAREDPPSPRSVAAGIPRNLEWIILKALEKEPERRYATAEALAEDLGRFLRAEAVRARAVGLLYRMRKVSRGPKTRLTVLALVLVGAIVGAAVALRRPSAGDDRRASPALARRTPRDDPQRKSDRFLYALWEETRSYLDGIYAARELSDEELVQFRSRVKDYLDRFRSAVQDPSAGHTTLARYFLARLCLETMDHDRALKEIREAIRIEIAEVGPNLGLYSLFEANACMEIQVWVLGEGSERSTLMEQARAALARAPMDAIPAGGQDVAPLAAAVKEATEGRADAAADMLIRLYETRRRPEFLWAAGVVHLAAALSHRDAWPTYLERSIRIQERLIDAVPNYAKARFARGHAYLLAMRGNLAVRDVTTAIRLMPDVPDGYVLRANALSMIGRPAEALPDCEKALSLDPDDDRAYIQRATALLMLGRIDDARLDAIRAIELNPGGLEGYVTRASIDFLAGRLSQAESDVEVVLRQDPNSANARSLLVTLSTLRGNLDEARAQCDAWIAADPHSPLAYGMRALIFLRLNRTDEAMDDAERAIALAEDLPHARIVRGIIAYGRGDYQRAREDLNFCASFPQFHEIASQVLSKLPD